MTDVVRHRFPWWKTAWDGCQKFFSQFRSSRPKELKQRLENVEKICRDLGALVSTLEELVKPLQGTISKESAALRDEAQKFASATTGILRSAPLHLQVGARYVEYLNSGHKDQTIDFIRDLLGKKEYSLAVHLVDYVLETNEKIVKMSKEERKEAQCIIQPMTGAALTPWKGLQEECHRGLNSEGQAA